MADDLSAVPISVIIITKNEEARLDRCLTALTVFDDIHIVDSGSADGTAKVAQDHGAQVTDFDWNGTYPRKKQWAINNVSLKYDWVFLIDADEVLTPAIEQEIQATFSRRVDNVAGFFVRGQTVYGGKPLRFGSHNNKLCLFHKARMMFPDTGEGALAGMGDMEGHYQPILKGGFEGYQINRIQQPLLHYAHESEEGWQARHERYAAWEHGMNKGNYWPKDPVAWRQAMKEIFRTIPMRGVVAFIHCYVFKLGVLEGHAGLKLAKGRYDYYLMIAALGKAERLKTPKKPV